MGAKPAGGEYGGRLYYIERPQLSIDLTYRMDTDERENAFMTTRNETQAFVERFNIQTQGWVYHPALMTYTFTLSPEWQQDISEANTGDAQESDAFFLGYSLDMNFLQSKPYSVNVFARSQRTTTTTSLPTTTETESDSYGATLWLKYDVLPTTLSVVHSTSEQSGFYLSQETRDEARLHMRHTRPGNDTLSTGLGQHESAPPQIRPSIRRPSTHFGELFLALDLVNRRAFCRAIPTFAAIVLIKC